MFLCIYDAHICHIYVAYMTRVCIYASYTKIRHRAYMKLLTYMYHICYIYDFFSRAGIDVWMSGVNVYMSGIAVLMSCIYVLMSGIHVWYR